MALVPAVSRADVGNGVLAQAGWAEMVGPFHVLILHFPIALLALAGLLELCQAIKPRPSFRDFITFILSLVVASAWLAVATGLCRGSSGEFVGDNFSRHKAMGILVATLSTAALALQFFGAPSATPWARLSYRFVLAASLGCLGLAAHFGGTLTHGEGFLTKGFASRPSPASASAPGARPDGPMDDLYTRIVAPALQAKCVSCHGPDKQKAGVRLDEVESLLAATPKRAAMIVAGQPLKSRMVEILLLPNDAEDRMPPQGKAPLSAEEILAIIQWITEGAKVPAGAARGTNSIQAAVYLESSNADSH